MKNFLLNLSRTQKIILIIFCDFIVGFLVWGIFGIPLASYLSSNMMISFIEIVKNQFYTFVAPIIVALCIFYFLGFYKSITRFKASGDGFFKALFGAISFGLVYILVFLIGQDQLQKNIIIIFVIQGFLLSSMFLLGVLLLREIAKYLLSHQRKKSDALPIVIYGAGAIGGELFNAINLDQNRKVVSFFDDDIDLHGTTKYGVPIISKEKGLKNLKKKFPNLQIYLAIPSLPSNKRRKVIEKLETLSLSVRSVPAFHEIISDSNALANLQPLSLSDLLPSERLDGLTFDYLHNKSVFVSGAGGSIGSELVRQILDNFPKTIILFEQSEYNLYRLREECISIIIEKNLNIKIIPILGDVKNVDQLQQVFHENTIDIVFHAAAYKHVHLVELSENIIPSVENNIFGTFNLCKVSAKFQIKRFILISTDKAVRPTNVMGATKRMAELICQSFDKEFNNTIFSMVRFGNVINSSGSVIPMFRQQIANGGPVTITHKKITRYFMTIPEAASLVISAGINASGGEVFLLDMGKQIKVYDIAERMIRLSGRSVSREKGDGGIEIIEIGLRPGEKMYEELLISGNEEKTFNNKIYKSIESSISFDEMKNILDHLKEVIDSRDFKKILNILKSKVDGYNP